MRFLAGAVGKCPVGPWGGLEEGVWAGLGREEGGTAAHIVQGLGPLEEPKDHSQQTSAGCVTAGPASTGTPRADRPTVAMD